MNRLPRDLDGARLAFLLGKLGYARTRQTGSHMRLSTAIGGEHHLTIPMHSPLRVGTLNRILSEVGQHHGLTRAELLGRLFD